MKPLIFDSHAHYDDIAFEHDRDTLLKSLPSHGIKKLINVSSDWESQEKCIRLSNQYSFIYASVGIHPSCTAELPENGIHIMKKRIKENAKVVAIGEIGLDYHYEEPNKNIQRRKFEEQMELANVLRLPVIIHSRDATADTIAILKQFPHVIGSVHCFSGSLESAVQILNLNYYLGFTGVITFKNAKKAVQAANVIPLSRLLVETDCPYMAPEPLRGKRSDSTMLYYTIKKLAEIKNVPLETLAETTYQNAARLFGIK